MATVNLGVLVLRCTVPPSLRTLDPENERFRVVQKSSKAKVAASETVRREAIHIVITTKNIHHVIFVYTKNTPNLLLIHLIQPFTNAGLHFHWLPFFTSFQVKASTSHHISDTTRMFTRRHRSLSINPCCSTLNKLNRVNRN